MLYAIVAVIAIIMDQLVKYMVATHVPLDAIGEDVIRLLPGFVHVTNVHNYGAAFSFLSGARWFFVILCIVFVLVVVYVLIKDIINTPGARWMAVIVLAGAVGNCIDRIFCGYVVDMFEFEFVRFPVFNVADIFITGGAIVFCICVLLEKPKAAVNVTALEQTVNAAGPVPDEAIPAETRKGNPPVQLPKAEPAPAPAQQKKPHARRHKRTEIPDFPKHAPAPAAPSIDPNDPFAEWEKQMNTVKETPAASAHVTYTQPDAAAAVPEPAEAPASAPEQTEMPTAPAEPTAQVVPEASHAPAAPVVPEAPAERASAAEEFNLDDILAEFKEL